MKRSWILGAVAVALALLALGRYAGSARAQQAPAGGASQPPRAAAPAAPAIAGCWSVVPSPNAGTPHDGIYGVAALAGNDVWAVGGLTTSSSNAGRHWNGTTWSVVPSPNPGTRGNGLVGVAAVAGNDVWAVGGLRVTPPGNRCWNIGTARPGGRPKPRIQASATTSSLL